MSQFFVIGENYSKQTYYLVQADTEDDAAKKLRLGEYIDELGEDVYEDDDSISGGPFDTIAQAVKFAMTECNGFSADDDDIAELERRTEQMESMYKAKLDRDAAKQAAVAGQLELPLDNENAAEGEDDDVDAGRED